MKKRNTKYVLLGLFALLFGTAASSVAHYEPVMTKAAPITLTSPVWAFGANSNYTNGADAATDMFGNTDVVASAIVNKNSPTTVIAKNATELRMYGIASKDGNSIDFTMASGLTAISVSITALRNGGAAATAFVTIAGTELNVSPTTAQTYGPVTVNASSFTIKNTSSAAAQIRISRIEIVYDGGSSDPIPVTGVSIDGSNSIGIGGTTQLTAVITPNNATDTDVVWTSLNPSVATVSTTGVVTGVAIGNTSISVTTDDGSFTATHPIEVTDAPAVETLVITQTSHNLSRTSYSSGAEWSNVIDGITIGSKATMMQGTNIQMQASNGRIYNIDPLPGRIIKVTLVQTGTVAFTLQGGSTGRLVNDTTANYTITGGTLITGPANAATMVWTPASSDNYTYFCLAKGTSAGYVVGLTVEYEGAPALDVPVASITLSGENQIVVNGTSQLSAAILPGNATNKNLIWSTSNDTIASVSQTGLVTGNAIGTATITATAQDGSLVYGTYNITVSKAPAVVEAMIKGSATQLNLGMADNEDVTARAQITNPGSAPISIVYIRNSASTHSIFNNGSQEIRLYNGTGSNGGQINISVGVDFLITNVVITTGTNTGLSINGATSITSTAINQAIEPASSMLTLKNEGTGQVQIRGITITYRSVGGDYLIDQMFDNIGDDDNSFDTSNPLSIDLYGNYRHEQKNYDGYSFDTFISASLSYRGMDVDKGLQIGTAGAEGRLVLLSNEHITNTAEMTMITIEAAALPEANVTVKVFVGNTQIGTTVNLTTTSTAYEFTTEATVLGSLFVVIEGNGFYLKQFKVEGALATFTDMLENPQYFEAYDEFTQLMGLGVCMEYPDGPLSTLVGYFDLLTPEIQELVANLAYIDLTGGEVGDHNVYTFKDAYDYVMSNYGDPLGTEELNRVYRGANPYVTVMVLSLTVLAALVVAVALIKRR